MHKSNIPSLLPWGLTLLVSFLAVYVWGHSFAWQLRSINSYQFFSILGLLAFSIMWVHYMMGLLQRLHIIQASKRYFQYSGYAVLLFILLHPGILIYQRYRDGYGLPPHSYETYVAPSMAWITVLGSVSLLIFLAYELHRFYAGKVWWKYIVAAGDLAMIAIFYHGLKLGSQLQGSWYQKVWWCYGILLLVALTYKYGQAIMYRLSSGTVSEQSHDSRHHTNV